MAIDRSFFSVTAQDVAALAGAAGADIVRGADMQAEDAAPVSEAGPGHLCFLSEKADKTLIARLSGAVVITTPALAEELPEDCAALVCGNPRLGFAHALGLMVAEIGACHPPQQAVRLDGVTVGDNVSIGENVSIGKGTIIEPGVVIHQGVEIGRNCRIGANAVLSHCRLGDEVRMGANNVIGGSGFGFEITDEGPVLLEHVGSVEIGRSSRIGAGCTIDRGTLGRTKIGESVMIDNLVHIAHNCIVGDYAVLAAQVGLAGGAILGEGAILAGQAGVGSQVTVGKGAIVMGQSGVTKDVPDHTTVVGFPAEETRKVWRERAALRRLLVSPRNGEA